MIGRCLRPQSGKTAVVLDHVGNTLRLGHHLEDREWSLEGERKSRDREKAPSVKVCPRCFAAMASRVSVCDECGHEFAPERRELETVDGELVELQAAARERKREQGSAQSIEDLIQLGRTRGYKNPAAWARYVMAARQTKGQWRKVK